MHMPTIKPIPNKDFGAKLKINASNKLKRKYSAFAYECIRG